MRNVKMMLLIALATLVGYEAFNWSVNRVYLNPGSSAVVRYKGPIVFGSRKTAEPGMWAENGEIGIQREMLGRIFDPYVGKSPVLRRADAAM